MAARARNALSRPIFIGAVSIVTFIASLVALVVVPQQAHDRAAGPDQRHRPLRDVTADRVEQDVDVAHP